MFLLFFKIIINFLLYNSVIWYSYLLKNVFRVIVFEFVCRLIESWCVGISAFRTELIRLWGYLWLIKRYREHWAILFSVFLRCGCCCMKHWSHLRRCVLRCMSTTAAWVFSRMLNASTLEQSIAPTQRGNILLIRRRLFIRKMRYPVVGKSF